VGGIRTVLIIGIGAGDPELLTGQAIAALNTVDVFFFIDKPNATADLATLRSEICARFISGHDYRIVHADEVERDRAPAAYAGTIADWRRRRAELYERLIGTELADEATGALLIWGEPGLYDGTVQIMQELADSGSVQFDYRVIPGISSVQLLGAAHRIALNRTGEAIHITTGRRLGDADTPLVNTFVLLDADCSFQRLDDARLDIYWGAYLGTAHQALISGPLLEVSESIVATRERLRAQHGWIMDTYLVRRRGDT
jgi:precorrin-6A synthase